MAKVSDTVIESFKNIIDDSLTLKQCRTLVSKLDAKVGETNLSRPYGRFTELAKYLDTVSVIMTGRNEGVIQIKSMSDPIRKIGGGAYGTIFLGNTGAVYKKIEMNNSLGYSISKTEKFHRELYIEAFIQCLLQCDTKYGNNIAKISNMYADTLVKTTSTLPLTSRRYIYYYKMENIPFTLKTYINSLSTPEKTFGHKLEKLGDILSHFRDTYGFYHRDLHGGNIMFDKWGNIKLIDFGMSCIHLNGVQYSVVNNPCISYDLFILTVYLLEYKIIPSLNTELNELLSDSRGLNIYNILYNLNKTTGDPLFHRCYYEYFIATKEKPWDNPDILNILKREIVPKLEPDAFSEFWKKYNNPTGTVATSTTPPISPKTPLPLPDKLYPPPPPPWPPKVSPKTPPLPGASSSPRKPPPLAFPPIPQRVALTTLRQVSSSKPAILQPPGIKSTLAPKPPGVKPTTIPTVKDLLEVTRRGYKGGKQTRRKCRNKKRNKKTVRNLK